MFSLATLSRCKIASVWLPFIPSKETFSYQGCVSLSRTKCIHVKSQPSILTSQMDKCLACSQSQARWPSHTKNGSRLEVPLMLLDVVWSIVFIVKMGLAETVCCNSLKGCHVNFDRGRRLSFMKATIAFLMKCGIGMFLFGGLKELKQEMQGGVVSCCQI